MTSQKMTLRYGAGEFIEAHRPAATKALLACGLVAGPVFLVVSGVQAAVRTGFEFTRHALSLLTLGDLGWVQVANFVGSGLLVMACAVGMSRAMRPGRGGVWGPLLVGVYGLGATLAGIFTPDPALGFPPGTPPGVPSAMSWHSALHGVVFLVAFLSLFGACLVFARGFAAGSHHWWAIYCVGTGLVAALFIVQGMTHPRASGLAFTIAGLLTWGWVTVIASHLMKELSHRSGFEASTGPGA